MPAQRTSEATSHLRAELVGHAAAIARRDGAAALTMRALAHEAGCSLGLIYKVFADREEIVAELIAVELDDLSAQFAAWLADTANHSVGENLDRYAAILLDSPVPPLIHSVIMNGREPEERIDSAARHPAFIASLDAAVADYLRLEQQRGRVRADVDAAAFGFLITGAVHNLVTAGDAYPRPSRPELTKILGNLARSITA